MATDSNLKRTAGAVGRQPKSAGEKYVTKSFRFPPKVWEEVERHIPRGQRSRIVQESLQQAAESLRWQRAAAEMLQYYTTSPEVRELDAVQDSVDY